MELLELDGGKYTIINTLHKGGNKFIIIDELIEENKKLKTLISTDVRPNDKKEKVEVY